MQHNQENRRSFLKHVLTGTAIVAGTTLTGKKAKAREKMKAEQPEEILYRETKNFQKYYESLR
jgi:hypothetical protein